MIPTNLLKKCSLIQNVYSRKSSLIHYRLGRILFLGIVVTVGTMSFDDPASGWERTTHRELTEQAIEFVASDLNAYLIDNLGLEGGLNTSVDGETIKQWLMKGSDLEDGPSDLSSRPLNHFHEPIENNGLELPVWGGISAIDWSLAPLGTQSPGGPWSWNDAREYYFKALTSPAKVERDENWGKTFRALGQVMHLLQDSANPSHVRDDPHPFNEGLHNYMARRSVGSYLSG